MSIATARAFPQSFDKELSKIYYQQYTNIPSEFDRAGIFKIADAPAGHDYSVAEMTGLGNLRELPEGHAIEFDTPAEGHKVTREYDQYGLGFQISPILLKDDLYGNWKKLPQSLAKSAAFKREVVAWDVLNGAFTTQLSWYGTAICADSHTRLKSGADSFDNKVASDLGQTALEAAFEYFDNLEDNEGFPLLAKLKTLVIDPGDKWMANDLLQDTGRVWDYSGTYGGMDRGLVTNAPTGNGSASLAASSPSAAGLKNWMNPSNGLVDDWKVFVCHWLTDSNSWFAIGNDPDIHLLWKEKPSLEEGYDINTRSKIYSVVMRLTAFCNDPIMVYGSTGAS